MRDRDLYAKLLGIEAPWFVRDVDAQLEAREVEVRIGFAPKRRLACPECGATCRRYDTRRRSWRHLDTMQYRMVLTADVPEPGRVEADARLRDPLAFIATRVGVVASAPPTDPDVQISRIRLLESELR